ELQRPRRRQHGRYLCRRRLPRAEGGLVNFPGLDPIWSFTHHAGHALRLIDTWSLDDTRAALENGEKVVVVATTALGDSLLTLPLVQTLSERLGRDRVSML